MNWISEIWELFDKNLLVDSFKHCGITSSDKLHSALGQILREKKLMNMLLILKKVHLTTAFSRSLIRLLKKTSIGFLLKSKMMKVKILILSQNQAQPKKRGRRVKMRMKTLLNQQLRMKKKNRLIQKKRSVTRYFNKFYPVQIQIIYQLMKFQPQKIKGLQLKKQQP